jgi:hypothetical protein
MFVSRKLVILETVWSYVSSCCVESTIFWRNKLSLLSAAGILFGLPFDPEIGDRSSKNVGLSLNYIALQPRRLYSSQ